MKKDKNSHNGFYFFWGVLCAVLICLKYTHVINWSWGLVLLPLYAPLVLIAVIVIIAIAYLVAEEVKKQL